MEDEIEMEKNAYARRAAKKNELRVYSRTHLQANRMKSRVLSDILLERAAPIEL